MWTCYELIINIHKIFSRILEVELDTYFLGQNVIHVRLKPVRAVGWSSFPCKWGWPFSQSKGGRRDRLPDGHTVVLNINTWTYNELCFGLTFYTTRMSCRPSFYLVEDWIYCPGKTLSIYSNFTFIPNNTPTWDGAGNDIFSKESLSVSLCQQRGILQKMGT